MKSRWVPMRWILPAVILLLAGLAYVQATTAVQTPQPEPEWTWYYEVPSPPVGVYVYTFIAAPGAVVSLPFVIAMAILRLPDWVAYVAFLPGIIFFWYFAGWQIDHANGNVHKDVPFAFEAFSRVMSVVSWIVLGLLVLSAGFNHGSYCGNSPRISDWDEYTIIGILVFWCIVGIFLTRKQASPELLSIREIS